METDDTDENSEGRTLSLLTLADLAIALQDQVDDHTYARNCDLPQILDEQCLLVKEKDHNYSTCSRTELRGRAKCASKAFSMKKSSSEENLTTLCSFDNKSNLDDFSLISKKSHSCEQVTLPDSENPKLVLSEISDAVSPNKLCSSWPKENVFRDYINDDLSMKKLNSGTLLAQHSDSLLIQQTVYDHTYARDENSTTTCITNNVDNLIDNLFHKDHNYDVRGKFSFNDPHKINLKKMKQTTKCSISNEHNKQNEIYRQSVKTNRPYFDHNYTYRSMQPHQSCGSVESLDMDLSESDTDSCEETEQEETKLYKQMMNAQKDHPYSKSGILSF